MRIRRFKTWKKLRTLFTKRSVTGEVVGLLIDLSMARGDGTARALDGLMS